MSAARVSPKRWLITADGALINLDYVPRIYVENNKPFCDLQSGEHHELALDQSLDKFFSNPANKVLAQVWSSL